MEESVESRLAVDTRTPASSAPSHRPRWLHRLMWSAAWDVAGRAVGVLWTGYLFLLSLLGLTELIAGNHAATMSAVALVTAAAARVAFSTFLLLLLVLFLVRLGPIAKARGIGARAVAIAGTFLPTLFGFLPRYDESAALNVASFTCIAVGNGLSVYGLTHLSRSASIMAEARRLVTTGPYRLVQHPVYLFEAIAVVGILLTYLWPPRVAATALALFAAYAACQLRRMRNEEEVLAATFPEAIGYRRRTARLIPGVY